MTRAFGASPQRASPHDAVERATRAAGRPRFLMCAPEYFEVRYVINPWMRDQIGKTVRARALEQWSDLRRLLAEDAEIVSIAPAPGLPDMAFCANAGLAIGNVAVVSRFRTKERRPEEPLFRAWFEAAGYDIAPWPEDVAFEGAGDALPDRERPIVWCGYGQRSAPEAPAILERVFGRRTVGLRLIDERFYHLDTCLCPLGGGRLMYYPPAFDAPSRAAIEALTPPEKRIAVEDADALSFSCNAVEVDGRVFMNEASESLRNRLSAAGFRPTITPLFEFVKAGGAAKCLTLELPAGGGDAASTLTRP